MAWTDALSEVERSIDGCLKSLDRYEAAFAKILGDTRPASPLWQPKLDRIQSSADDLEDILKEQDAVWARWQETLSHWRGAIKSDA